MRCAVVRYFFRLSAMAAECHFPFLFYFFCRFSNSFHSFWSLILLYLVLVFLGFPTSRRFYFHLGSFFVFVLSFYVEIPGQSPLDCFICSCIFWKHIAATTTASIRTLGHTEAYNSSSTARNIRQSPSLKSPDVGQAEPLAIRRVICKG